MFEGPNMLYIGFTILLVFAIVLWAIAFHSNRKEKHLPPKL